MSHDSLYLSSSHFDELEFKESKLEREINWKLVLGFEYEYFEKKKLL